MGFAQQLHSKQLQKYIIYEGAKELPSGARMGGKPTPTEQLKKYIAHREEVDLAAALGKPRPSLPQGLECERNWHERQAQRVATVSSTTCSLLGLNEDKWGLCDRAHENKDKFLEDPNGNNIRDEHGNHIMLQRFKARGWGEWYKDKEKRDPMITAIILVATGFHQLYKVRYGSK